MEFTETLTFRIVKMATAHRIEVERRIVDLDLHAGQVLVLFELWKSDGLNQTALASLLGVSAATVNRMVRSLQSNGFVEIRSNPDDGRHKLVHLTPKSDQIRKELELRWESLEKSLRSNLTVAERMLLFELTEKVSSAFGNE